MPSDNVLSNLFRQSAPDAGGELHDDARLEEALGKLLTSARAAWPSLAVSPQTFIPYLVARFSQEAWSVEGLEELRAADLYLACACAHGDSSAIAAFETMYVDPIFPLPRHLAASGDVRQIASVKLLVREGDRLPKIADYSGRGDLGSWVSVVVLRVALSLMRGQRREIAFEEDTALFELADRDDAEVAHLKRRYRAEFAEAFHFALGSLRPRERNLLRQHYVDALTMEQISRVYRVHRITVVRWIDKARTTLAAETRRHLVTRLGVQRGELDSILRLIRSQIDVSLRTHLRSDAGPREP